MAPAALRRGAVLQQHPDQGLQRLNGARAIAGVGGQQPRQLFNDLLLGAPLGPQDQPLQQLTHLAGTLGGEGVQRRIGAEPRTQQPQRPALVTLQLRALIGRASRPAARTA
mgnify:CR=1 FL=1